MSLTNARTGPPNEAATNGDIWETQFGEARFVNGVWVPQNSLFYGGMPPALAGLKYVPIVGANLPTGDNDLYTVPAGRSAYYVMNQFRAYNPSVGSITAKMELKIGGVYYLTTTGFTMLTGTGTSLSVSGSMVLSAGESISVNTTTTAGLNVRGGVYEFDASDTRLASSRNLALASGDTIIYSVPTGKSSLLLGNTQFAVNAAGIFVVNNTGGNLNYYVNIVPSGGSAASTNQLFPATAINNGAGITALVVGDLMLASGDFVSVNSSGADAGSHQIAWVTYYQI